MADADYPGAFLGAMTTFNFTATAIRIRLGQRVNGAFRRRDFEIRVTQNCRILQGSDTVAVTATSGRYTPTSMIRRVTITSPDNAYISVIRDTANGAIEIGNLTDEPSVADDDAPANVT